ncbi:hypothetical protein ACIQCM_13630 [Pseudarthrobacter sp. NPDC092439]|uniref:hypothetical protein n=1 Tax=unclassified Pseudarthrobacter TaxID=2647000 RepID=UPI00381323DE
MTRATGKPRGRPSKGPRHSFVVKLDLERAAKLKGILASRRISGIQYLTPIIEAHIDNADVQTLADPAEAAARAMEMPQDDPADFDHGWPYVAALRRAEILAKKINLLLDARTVETGHPLNFPEIYQAAEKIGYKLSRTRWSRLKNGQFQVVPHECLHAIATVFDVAPEYLLREDAKLPAQVEAMLPRVRIKRLYEVRNFATKALGRLDPEGLSAITRVLDQAVERKAGGAEFSGEVTT